MRQALKAIILAAFFAMASPALALAPVSMPDITELVEKLLPATVEISVQSKNPARDDGNLLDDAPFKNFMEDFLKRKQQGDAKPKGTPEEQKDSKKDDKKGDDNSTLPPSLRGLQNSLGSGFIIDPKGLIVTNNHVIENAVVIQVHMQDGTLLKAELVGRDAKADIAVIRVKPDHDLPFVTFGDSDKLRIGQWVIAIGNPYGLGGSVSFGIVSAKSRDINAGPYDNFIQTDATINRGNSGGPLFNLAGEVIGVNTAIFSPTGASVGIGFAVPANEAKLVANQLIKYGETRRGLLGVKLQAITPDLAESLGLAKPSGALVADVTADGPSAKAGLKAGDVIVNFNGRVIDDTRTLRRVVAETDAGKEVAVTAIRDGKEMNFKVTLGRLEEADKPAGSVGKAVGDTKKKDATPATGGTEVLGLRLADITDELAKRYKLDAGLKGAVITEVGSDSPAVELGLQAGDVITEAGAKKVTAASDVKDAVDAVIKAGRANVLVVVQRGTDTRYIAIKVKK